MTNVSRQPRPAVWLGSVLVQAVAGMGTLTLVGACWWLALRAGQSGLV